MRTAQCAGPSQVTDLSFRIASFFTGSPEYAGRARNSADYVEDLYDAVIRRGADPDGYNFWVGGLEEGTWTRENILLFFTDSPEFQTRVQEVIDAGCAP